MITTFLLVLSLACGEERWSVKTGHDIDVRQIATTPVTASVGVLGNIPKPDQPPEDRRVNQVEKTIYEIRTKIIAFKLEKDGDLHAIIVGDSSKTMVIEFPDSTCLHGSVLESLANKARLDFLKTVPRLGRAGHMIHLKEPVRCLVRGVGFFDKVHGQSGVAKNGIELHPVLYFGELK